MKNSRYICWITEIPKSLNESAWIDIVIKEIQKNKVDIVIPVDERAIRILSKYRRRISDYSLLVPLPRTKTFDLVNNKWRFYQFLDQNGFPAIPTQLLANLGNIKLEIPSIVKPVTQTGGGRGIIRIDSPGDLERILAKISDSGNYILQPLIDGVDMGVNVLCLNGRILAFTVQRATLIGAKAFSPYLAMEFTSNGKLMDTISEMIDALNWSGVANIDLRMDSNDGEYKIVEFNPRYWVTLEGSCLMGVNFPVLAIRTALGESFEPPDYRLQKFITLSGLWHCTKHLQSPGIASIFTHRTPMKFAFGDPATSLARLISSFRRNSAGNRF
jgi:predicted ATP-grasp superfamily ATP-dependent carboligase